jgi:hypothetical protein
MLSLIDNARHPAQRDPEVGSLTDWWLSVRADHRRPDRGFLAVRDIGYVAAVPAAVIDPDDCALQSVLSANDLYGRARYIRLARGIR